MVAQLHQTRMGVALIEGTLPNMLTQLKRIADSLENQTSSDDLRKQWVNSLRKDLEFDTGDPTMRAGGKKSWELQVNEALAHLNSEVMGVVEEVMHDLFEGCYAKSTKIE